VPDLVSGEAFTKLRYDRRVSSRRDARIALRVFEMVDDNPAAFAPTQTPPSAHRGARGILARYRDHAFSYVDAVIFHLVAGDIAISRILTVDGADFRSFDFGRAVEVVTP
jgi:predicted nucleic acid-binding protein